MSGYLCYNVKRSFCFLLHVHLQGDSLNGSVNTQCSISSLNENVNVRHMLRLSVFLRSKICITVKNHKTKTINFPCMHVASPMEKKTQEQNSNSRNTGTAVISSNNTADLT